MKMNWDEAVEFKFKIKDEDSLFKLKDAVIGPEKEFKSTKDKTIEHAMDQVGDALSGKNFRRMLGAIEQQIRYAYKQGYEEGEKNRDDRVEKISVEYAVGYNSGYEKGRDEGYNAGYDKGRLEAVTATEEDLQKKYHMGVIDGRISAFASYDIGKKDGFKDGYAVGYREGRNNLREELKEVIFNEDK